MKNIVYISILFVFACGNKKNTEPKVSADTNQISHDSVKTGINQDTILLDFSGYVLNAIKENDGEKIASYIHPKIGVRFSPYTNVDTVTDVRMLPSQFAGSFKGKRKMVWGSYSAGEEVINMSMAEYFKRFVYDLDFLELGQISLNKSKASGTMINNIKEIYPDADYVEYYIPGVDKKFDGMDWRALTLVFKKYEDNFYLVGIVHSEWTT
jgi:hypothetical protein